MCILYCNWSKVMKFEKKIILNILYLLNVYNYIYFYRIRSICNVKFEFC